MNKAEIRENLVKEYQKPACNFCKAKFNSKPELEKHKAYQHTSFSKEAHTKHIERNPNSKVGKIYKKHYIDKKSIYETYLKVIDEPIINLGGITYVWDCFKGCYYKYILGVGLIDEIKNQVIADESSEYYRKVVDLADRISDEPELLKVKHKIPHKPKKKPLSLKPEPDVSDNVILEMIE